MVNPSLKKRCILVGFVCVVLLRSSFKYWSNLYLVSWMKRFELSCIQSSLLSVPFMHFAFSFNKHAILIDKPSMHHEYELESSKVSDQMSLFYHHWQDIVFVYSLWDLFWKLKLHSWSPCIWCKAVTSFVWWRHALFLLLYINAHTVCALFFTQLDIYFLYHFMLWNKKKFDTNDIFFWMF